jgi:hypothetical protein
MREGRNYMTKKPKETKTVFNLEANDCRWPIGDPRDADFHFCGAQKVSGRPYLRNALAHVIHRIKAALSADHPGSSNTKLACTFTAPRCLTPPPLPGSASHQVRTPISAIHTASNLRALTYH